jgi:hypothetical protein
MFMIYKRPLVIIFKKTVWESHQSSQASSQSLNDWSSMEPSHIWASYAEEDGAVLFIILHRFQSYIICFMSTAVQCLGCWAAILANIITKSWLKYQLHSIGSYNVINRLVAIHSQVHQLNRITSEGQEKYLRELSITPVGYFTGARKNHSRAVSHRNYFAWRKWGISEEQEWFSQG